MFVVGSLPFDLRAFWLFARRIVTRLPAEVLAWKGKGRNPPLRLRGGVRGASHLLACDWRVEPDRSLIHK